MICVGLRGKFYIVTVLLACMVVFGWYGVWFWSANEIMMEDAPMSAEMKTLFAVLMALIVSTWTLSLFTLLRQILAGAAFTLDRNGIHTTATAIIVLAFIIVVPVKRIPFDAIRSLREEDGVLVATLDKSKIALFPPLRLFVRREYRFFFGFAKQNPEQLRRLLLEYTSLTVEEETR